jgi:hypothetical protein
MVHLKILLQNLPWKDEKKNDKIPVGSETLRSGSYKFCHLLGYGAV